MLLKASELPDQAGEAKDRLGVWAGFDGGLASQVAIAADDPIAAFGENLLKD